MLRVCSRSIQSLTLSRVSCHASVANRRFCEKVEKNETEQSEEKKLSGFAKAFEKYSKPQDQPTEEKLPDLPFASLLRNSKFIDVSNI